MLRVVAEALREPGCRQHLLSAVPVELSYVQAVILGVVERLTEFLPISSHGGTSPITERLLGLPVDDPRSRVHHDHPDQRHRRHIYFGEIARLMAWVRGLRSPEGAPRTRDLHVGLGRRRRLDPGQHHQLPAHRLHQASPRPLVVSITLILSSTVISVAAERHDILENAASNAASTTAPSSTAWSSASSRSSLPVRRVPLRRDNLAEPDAAWTVTAAELVPVAMPQRSRRPACSRAVKGKDSFSHARSGADAGRHRRGVSARLLDRLAAALHRQRLTDPFVWSPPGRPSSPSPQAGSTRPDRMPTQLHDTGVPPLDENRDRRA